ncbi:4-hydroxybenzoate 3-monooxygenase [Pseudaestuariivita atlantica]|uniref:4-hydroxybenzoate 3-monooxygenase n=1 Tax=Pseudaestuariivita atlantica TaxID=1317121 RepID=A0A0L1JS23_9RHOB|nr:4-hydroxybenzoate 3-monooxygenase [Pseudaestuariivita atlantica]KNG94550.1 4-hydroxybenzoate 3-monooxygenase [Pseudaestuariivita atlantica]
MRTSVVIIGGGPAGLLLGQHLNRAGIDNVILERRTRDHVLGRIRAGVLEIGTVEQMRSVGLGARMDRKGFVHDGTIISYNNDEIRIDFAVHTDRSVLVYGQTEVTRDLYEGRDADGAQTLFEVDNAVIEDATTDAPFVTFTRNDQGHRIDCDYIAGCDGFHGVSRPTIPAEVRREYEKVYPFGWLGILSETPPVHDELIYANSDAGFALCSMRNANLSRYYIQCDASDDPASWSDQAFWDELRRRIPGAYADILQTGPSIEKSIAPLRSFVCEPMQWGRLFLCGDAAHIVPPTGAKGLNTAASDVYYLANALKRHYLDADGAALAGYSERALARVWKAERFSWWMTRLLHHFPDQSAFDHKMQMAEVAFLKSNAEAQSVLAQNYVGLPY